MESKANTKQKDNMQENNRFNNDKIYKNIKLPLKSLALFIFIMSFAIDKLYSCTYHINDAPAQVSAAPGRSYVKSIYRCKYLYTCYI